MSIDLATLQIPDVWVVPEPDEIDVREVWNLMFDPAPNKYDRVVCGLARRCRELEKRDHQAAEAYAAKCETQRYLEDRITGLESVLSRYQQCYLAISKLFPADPLAEADPAHTYLERLESIVARRLLVPASRIDELNTEASQAYAAKCETQRYLEAEIERLKRELTKANTPVGWRDK